MAMTGIFLAAALVHGQGFSVGGFGGYGMPLGPELISEYWKGGLGFGGEIRFDLNERTKIALTYLNQTLKSDIGLEDLGLGLDDIDLDELTGYGFDVDMSLSGMDIKSNIITANIVQYLNNPGGGSAVYGTAGIGYYMIGVSDVKFEYSVSGSIYGVYFDESDKQTIDMSDEGEDKFGINGGLGLEMKAGSMILFAEAKLHYVFTDLEEPEEDFDKEGGNMMFLSILGGIRMPLGM